MSIVQQFPTEWRVAVAVRREGKTDPKGNKAPPSFHDVEDCLVTTQATEEEARTDLSDTSAYLFADPGANFASDDVVTVPEGPGRLWPWGRFIVNGDVNYGPLGTRVQLRRV